MNNLPFGILSCRHLVAFFTRKSSMDNKYAYAFAQSERNKLTTIWVPTGEVIHFAISRRSHG